MVELNHPAGWGTAMDPETEERIPLDKDVAPEVARRLADRYDRIEIDGELEAEEDDEGEDEDGDEESSPDGESGTLPFNPESHTVDEIKEAIAEIDDVEAVRALRNIEQEQKDRETAVDALNARIDDLNDTDEE